MFKKKNFSFSISVVEQMGSDFVCNFIQSMDGERDPRNLVLCFQCLQCMVKYLDIGKFDNELKISTIETGITISILFQNRTKKNCLKSSLVIFRWSTNLYVRKLD